MQEIVRRSFAAFLEELKSLRGSIRVRCLSNKRFVGRNNVPEESPYARLLSSESNAIYCYVGNKDVYGVSTGQPEL